MRPRNKIRLFTNTFPGMECLRSFSEMEAPATFTADYVFKHLEHYVNAMGAVLPGAWMLNLRVHLSENLQVHFRVTEPGDITSDEQLRRSSELHNVCVNALLALIGRPTVAGHTCVFVEKDSDDTPTGVVVQTPPPQEGKFTARLYIGKEYIQLSIWDDT